LQQGLQYLLSEDARSALSNIPVPSLWLSGRRDRLVSPAAMQAAAAQCANSQYYEFTHGGHAPFITHASEVAEQIKQFARDIHYV
jgi:pimeloyl-[acyl-carrier protein] methyl ester esterase